MPLVRKYRNFWLLIIASAILQLQWQRGSVPLSKNLRLWDSFILFFCQYQHFRKTLQQNGDKFRLFSENKDQ